MIALRDRNQTSKWARRTMARLPWASATILGFILSGCDISSLFFPPIYFGATIERADIPFLKGVIITGPGENADLAGLKKNDIIVRIADKPIPSLDELRAALNVEMEVQVEVEVYRPKLDEHAQPALPLTFLEQFFQTFFDSFIRRATQAQAGSSPPQAPVVTPSGSWMVLTLTLPRSSPTTDNPQVASDANSLGPIGSVQTMTSQLAERKGYANWKGVRLTEIRPRSEAEKQRMSPGDIIIGFRPLPGEEERVESMTRFERLISDNANKEVMLRYARDGIPHTVTLTLSLYEPNSDTPRPNLGLVVVNDDIQPGIKIQDIVSGGAAEHAGLEQNDFITEIDSQTVDSVDGFYQIVVEKISKTQNMVLLEIQRQGTTLLRPLLLPSPTAPPMNEPSPNAPSGSN